MKRVLQNRIEVSDSWITIDIYGEPDGPAIVLIPGVMADAAGWAPVAQQLAGWPTVVVMNRRGRHSSGPLGASYSIQTEVEDAQTVLRQFTEAHTVFGWSLGGLIALHLAAATAVEHLIAYEPIVAPFGAAALKDLKMAQESGDLDQSIIVALGQVAEMPASVIASLRSDPHTWSKLRDVAAPLYQETRAISNAPLPDEFGLKANRVDLIIGQRNEGKSPYGTAFRDVVSRTPRGASHVLEGQGHLAHIEAPEQLAAVIDLLRNETA